MCDDYNHVIEEGKKYLKCNYLEKKSEKKGNIFYKKLEKTVCFTCTGIISICVIEG